MLTALDAELFPEDCEVVEMPLHNQWVYQIFKNGRSTLRTEYFTHGYKVYRNQEIRDLNYVDVYLRDPQKRYVSGINTYIQYLKKEESHLDTETIIWMALRYKFLNRHYLPQWHWLLNLNKFIKPTTILRLRRLEDLHLITNVHRGPTGINDYDQEFTEKIMRGIKGMELWFYLDQVLRDLAGQSMTWREILDHYQQNHKELYQIVCQDAL